MGKLQIIVEDETLDLFPGSGDDFFITKQGFDLSSLDVITASFTRQFAIPKSPKNQRLLQHALLAESQGIRQFQRLPCSVRVEDIDVIPFGELYIDGSEKDGEIRVVIYSDNFTLFERLQGKMLSDLDLSDLDFTMDEATVLAKSNPSTTDAVTVPLIDWIEQESAAEIAQDVFAGNLIPLINIKAAGFAIKIRELLTRVISEAGFILDDASLMNTASYEKEALACPVDKFVFTEDPSGSTAEGLISSTVQQSIQPADPQFYQVQFETVDTATGVSTGTNSFITSAAFELVNITFQARVDFTNLYPPEDSYIEIRKNGTMIARTVMETTTPAQRNPFTLQVTNYPAVSGDEFTVWMFRGGVETPDPDDEDTDILGLLITLAVPQITLAYQSATAVSNNINVAAFMPEMTQRDFLKAVLNLYGAVLNTNNVTGIVNVVRFRDIVEVSDYSDYLDTSRPMKHYNSLSGYGKKNVFKFAGDEAENLNYTEQFFNQIPENEVTVIGSPFVASASAAALQVNEARIPAYTAEIITPSNFVERTGSNDQFNVKDAGGATVSGDMRPGDILLIAGDTLQVVSVTTNKTFGTLAGTISNAGLQPYQILRYKSEKLTAPRIVNIESAGRIGGFFDGASTFFTHSNPVLAGRCSVSWMDLVEENYVNILESVDRVYRVQCWLKMPGTAFREADVTKYVYISFLNSLFYLNKLEQWKPNQSVRAELIKVQ